MAKRGLFGRMLDAVFGRKPTPAPPPRIPALARSVSPGEPAAFRKPRGELKERVVNHIVSVSPLANRRRVADHVEYMDIDELEWTLQASTDQIKARAKQDADRIGYNDEGDEIPMNPWWYR
jgi:hypothetical protein